MFDIVLYFFLENKPEEVIRDFLTKYNVDSGKILQTEALIFRSEASLPPNDLHDEWIEIKDTDSWIKLGLSEKTLAFSIYYSLPTQPIIGLIVTFTIDGGLLFGIIAEDNEINISHLKKILDDSKNEYNSIGGGIFGGEEPPSFSKKLFVQSLNARAFIKLLE